MPEKTETNSEIYAAEIRRLQKKFPKEFAQNPRALIVREAAKENSPIHDYFEWDDSEAAVKYRLEQAGCLMRECKTVFTNESSHRMIPVNQFTFADGDGSVRETRVLLQDPESRTATMALELNRYAGAAERLSGYLTGAGFHELSDRLDKFTAMLRVELEGGDELKEAG